jgi:hypothetical protein
MTPDRPALDNEIEITEEINPARATEFEIRLGVINDVLGVVALFGPESLFTDRELAERIIETVLDGYDYHHP